MPFIRPTRHAYGSSYHRIILDYRALLYLHIVLGDDPQEVDVVIRVEASHLLATDGFGPKYLHLSVQTVVHDQVVGHADSVRFHGVPLPIVVVADFGCFNVKRGTRGLALVSQGGRQRRVPRLYKVSSYRCLKANKPLQP